MAGRFPPARHTPVVWGTRVPVYDVVRSVAAGLARNLYLASGGTLPSLPLCSAADLPELMAAMEKAKNGAAKPKPRK